MSPGSQQQSSLIQCSNKFQPSICTQTIFQFLINLLMLLTLTWLIVRRFQYEGILRLPKTKTVILILLWFSLLSEFIFDISGIHFTYYLYLLLESQYFICIVYYFIKKLMKAENIQYRLRICKIIIGIIMLFFFCEFIYSNAADKYQSRDICGQIQYTLARVVALIIQLLLTFIGWYLYKSLLKKISVTQQMTLNDRNRQRLHSTRQDITKLLNIILIFLIAQLVLLLKILFFISHPANHCKYVLSNNAQNALVYFIIKIFGNYLPQLYTMKVFALRSVSSIVDSNDEQMIARTMQQSHQKDRDTMLVRKSLYTDQSSLSS